MGFPHLCVNVYPIIYRPGQKILLQSPSKLGSNFAGTAKAISGLSGSFLTDQSPTFST